MDIKALGATAVRFRQGEQTIHQPIKTDYNERNNNRKTTPRLRHHLHAGRARPHLAAPADCIGADNDYSSLHLACLTNPQDCMERLMEDLPKVMEEWL